jgi:uncharacterized coiled-coil DUF342 family protein
MDEIVSLEKMIQKFVVENNENESEKIALYEKAITLEKENQVLIQKIKDLEKKLNKAEEVTTTAAKTQLNFSERENLKDQIDDLIARIDYHIRS